MLIDACKRSVDYLRISVTDRCNLRCIYCMPKDGILQKAPQEILSFEEITRIVKVALSLGINKIKITGGEPLVRRDLPRLIHLLSSLIGLEDLSLTTNGILLKKYARELKKAGLRKLNISIDSLDSQMFKRITREGNLEDVLNGLDAAINEGFFIKLNVVAMRGLNDQELLKFVRFAQERKIIVRFIEWMPLADNSAGKENLYISCQEIKNRLKILGNFKPIISKGLGNGPAEYYKIEGTSLIVGFISPISCKFCFHCNRLRLTSDGLLIPCLVSAAGLDLKQPLREDKEEEVAGLIKKAVSLKPEGHSLTFFPSRQYLMSQIGG